ncbi:hypothetical protein KSP40_PGU006840 [Platanthera guangdongensis]|uniref:DUF4378 domain-containing protein n=1 Tax=Platanthera guangdongensis TaxID=2320717 RepID=A0ABR2MKG8_9ASPA
MDKEMSRTHNSEEFISKIEWTPAELLTRFASDKNDKEATDAEELSASPSLTSQQYDYPDMSKMLSSNTDLDAFMLDYCSNFLEKPHQNQLLREYPGTKKFKKQNGRYFSKKMEKSTVIDRSKEIRGAKDLNRIVVLKPTHVRNQNLSSTVAPVTCVSTHCGLGNKEGIERFSFSLKEIRRRFRNLIGASRKHPIAMDGLLHKIPYGKQVTIATENEAEKKNAFSDASEISGQKKMCENSSPKVLQAEVFCCDEARKFLAESLQIGGESDSFPPIHTSKTLGRILSFPGYSSPRLTPTRENQKTHPEKTYLEAENEVMEIIEIEEVSHVDAQSVLISDEDVLPSEIFKEEESSMLPEPEQSEAGFEPSTPSVSKSSKIQEQKETECAMDDADRPSPVSVLEPLIFKDINIPTSMSSWRLQATNAETQTQPKESQIDNSAAASCSTDADADLISCTEFNEALLFDELETLYGTTIDDPRLLFDSIDEVLTEIKERHFSYTSWASFIWPTISSIHKHEYFMKEACRRMNWHLDVQLPKTSEQAVKKDLDGTAWIDLRSGAKNTVNLIGDSIMDCLFEEIALELCLQDLACSS